MKALVTDGENRAALAVTRSLGRGGHVVVVGEKMTPCLAQASRYCTTRVTYPDPATAPEAFIDSLVATVQEQSIDVLLPVADITTFLITRNRARFPASCAIPFAPADVVERASDKVNILQTAQRIGVPIPRSVVITERHAPVDLDFGYPVVVKPWKSRIWNQGRWVATSVSHAADRDALARDLASRESYEFPVLVQERIVGPGTGVFACYHEGRAVALFSHRRLRERPPWGGVSVLCESVALPPNARDYATRLLEEIGWQGIAMVEFKLDEKDNEPKLMEINGRFWGSLQLAVDAGVDFPMLLAQSAASRTFEPQPPYRLGVRSRWLWGDFDSLLMTLGTIGPRNGSALPERWSAVREFAKFWGSNLYYDNPKLDDHRPWFVETQRRFKRVMTALTGEANGTQRAETRQAPASSNGIPKRALSTEVVSDLAQVRIDEADWNALVRQNDTNSVFQTRQWFDSWLEVFRESSRPLIVSVRQGSTIVGIAPLMVVDRARHRVLRFLADQRADYCDFLTSPARTEVLSAMFGALERYGDWHAMELNNLPAESGTVDAIREIGEHAGYHVLVCDQSDYTTLMVEGREAEAREIFNKPSLRRRQNYFKRTGNLVFRELTTPADIQPYLDCFFNQHVARWAPTGSPSLFVDPRNRQFYHRLTANVAGAGWVLFSVVELDDHPIAFHFGFDYNASVIWYKPSFDIRFAPHSPGMVLLKHLIGYTIDHGRRELDFTMGQEAFKKRFTNASTRTVQVHVFKDYGRYMLERSKRSLVSTVKRLAN